MAWIMNIISRLQKQTNGISQTFHWRNRKHGSFGFENEPCWFPALAGNYQAPSNLWHREAEGADDEHRHLGPSHRLLRQYRSGLTPQPVVTPSR